MKPLVKIAEAILTALFQVAKEQRKSLNLFVDYEENISGLRWETRQNRKMLKILQKCLTSSLHLRIIYLRDFPLDFTSPEIR